MDFITQEITTTGIKRILKENNREIARIRVYFINNNLHPQPYALIEDLFVQEKFRGKSYGTKLLQTAILEAQKKGCYKIIATSRYEREKVHEFYKKHGFKEYGKEFRMDLKR